MQAFKYELQPDGRQERYMCRTSGACRFVFNKALAIQKENYEAGNKFISYVAMARQLTQLEYKLEWTGEMLLAVPPENTSRACPNCKHISEHNRKTQSQFECISYGYKNHADVVGAINILERGHRLLACGEVVFRPLKEAGPRRSDSVNL